MDVGLSLAGGMMVLFATGCSGINASKSFSRQFLPAGPAPGRPAAVVR
jgi:hypothetical protein